MHEDITMLLIELGAVILGLGLLGRFAGRFGFSPIPLYLLAGLAFGHGGLLPLAASEEFVAIGAEIGVILLLFMLGLEYTAAELVGTLDDRSTRPAWSTSCSTPRPAPPSRCCSAGVRSPRSRWRGVTWISSSGVIAKVLGDLGRLGNRETPVVLSMLVLEDLAMAVYLPILTALLAGVGLVGGSITLLIALGTVSVVLFVALRYGRVISRPSRRTRPGGAAARVLGLTLLVAGIAQQLQVSAAVGAFLVGIALSGPVAHARTAAAHPAAGPVRRGLLRLLRPQHRPGDDAAGAAARARPGGADHADQDRSPAGARPAGPASAARAGGGPAWRWSPRGEFSIVIAGLAVASASNRELGPLATAYVLILVIVGPLAARYTEPLASRFIKPQPLEAPAIERLDDTANSAS